MDFQVPRVIRFATTYSVFHQVNERYGDFSPIDQKSLELEALDYEAADDDS